MTVEPFIIVIRNRKIMTIRLDLQGNKKVDFERHEPTYSEPFLERELAGKT